MAVIELDDVEVCYGDLKALNGVSCRIEGGTVGLLGPNGAGKSTMLKTLLGFNRATRGTVKAFGMKLPEESLSVRMELGYMPERDIISPKVSAVSFITYCGRLFGMSRVDAMERTHEVLNYVGLGEARYRKMDTYSTGMLQRVKLAQALVHDPKLLLLDEPTNGLDPQGRIEMLELIREVAARRKVTIILSSHLLPDIQHVCDSTILIQGGIAARAGAISDLTAVVEQCFEVRVRDNKDAFVKALASVGFDYVDQQDGNIFITAPDTADPKVLFEIAQRNDTQIRHFRPARHSLSEVFTQVAGKD